MERVENIFRFMGLTGPAFIKLTDATSGRPIYVNPNEVAFVTGKILGNGTVIVIAGGVAEVTETPEEIFGIEVKKEA